MAATPKFTFPYVSLTPIDGKPTNTTLQVLQRQLYTNARSVPSPCGGGNHGHLAMVLSAPDYLLRTGVPFIIPVHPGPPPEATGTSATIAVAIRNYNDALTDVTLYNSLSAALTSQILTAVNALFLSALEDPDFGFGDVTPLTMLNHLRAEYGTMTPEELERNRLALSEPWNFDNPIEDLWGKLANIQRVAALGGVPIPEITIVTLTLAMIEATGLLATTTEKFRLRPTSDWTIALFKSEFLLGTNKECVRRLTAGAAGFTAPIMLPLRPRLTLPLLLLPSLPLPLDLPRLSPLPLAMLVLRAASCITVGRTVSRRTVITLLLRATAKRQDTKTTPLHFECKVATIPLPPAALANSLLRQRRPLRLPRLPTDAAGSLSQRAILS